MSPTWRWAVELESLGKSYAGGWLSPRRWVLHGLTLRVERGQVLGLLGPNGSGKSTTLKALAGLLTPSRGVCRIEGFVAGSRAARYLVGYLPEAVRFPGHANAWSVLEYAAALSSVPPREVRTRVTGLLAWAGLTEAAHQPVKTFSKGMRQRLGLAQAIVHEPTVVLLDEPASGLDPSGRREVASLIRDLAVQGRTVVFSSHLLMQAESVCDRLALLGNGQLLAEGTPAELLGGERNSAEQLSPLERLYLEKIYAKD